VKKDVRTFYGNNKRLDFREAWKAIRKVVYLGKIRDRI